MSEYAGDIAWVSEERVGAEIRTSEVAGTLCQVVVDLSTGELDVRVRRKERADVWDQASGLGVQDLIEEAAGRRAEDRR